jgi:hypothetical protein
MLNQELSNPLIEDKSSQSPKSEIKISLYTVNNHDCECCLASMCDCMIFSHCCLHSSAVIERTNDQKKYIISLGGGLGGADFLTDQERINDSIQYGRYREFKPVIIKAYEEGDRTFKNFKRDYLNEYYKFDCCRHNCANATTFAIDYFPKDPTYHESHGESCSRWTAKACFGFFGTVLGIRACPTFPGLTTPREAEKYARKIEHHQHFFSQKSKGPEYQTMIDSNSATKETSDDKGVKSKILSRFFVCPSHSGESSSVLQKKTKLDARCWRLGF